MLRTTAAERLEFLKNLLLSEIKNAFKEIVDLFDLQEEAASRFLRLRLRLRSFLSPWRLENVLSVLTVLSE